VNFPKNLSKPDILVFDTSFQFVGSQDIMQLPLAASEHHFKSVKRKLAFIFFLSVLSDAVFASCGGAIMIDEIPLEYWMPMQIITFVFTLLLIIPPIALG
jgi:hypothetical protein